MAEFIINGKSQADKRFVYDKLNNLRNATYRVEITEVRQSVSSGQRGYYWKVIVGGLAEYFGYNKDEMHELLKSKFLMKGSVLPNGEFVCFPGSSEELNTKEREEYHEAIRVWSLVEFGYVIQLPNEEVDSLEGPEAELAVKG